MQVFSSTLSAVAALLVPKAHASLQDVISIVAGNALIPKTTGTLGEIIAGIANAFIPIAAVIAIVIVMFAGFRLAIDPGSQQADKARNAVISALAALIIIGSAVAIRDALIGFGDGGGAAAATSLGQIIRDIFAQLEIPAGAAAVLMIVISGIRAVTSYGSDEGLTHIRRTIFSVLFGVFLIAAKAFLVDDTTIIPRSPDPIITAILTIVGAILGFVTLLAVVVIIYAGIMMIVNVDNEEQYTKAKGIIARVAIGLIVILCAAAIAALVMA
ncbi:MAG: hypothetical protein PHH13_01740 [Candidatus Peribacteraceae bacterium]|nr:hypothetical protein [Candidatus Peribacteraceae bacterium]